MWSGCECEWFATRQIHTSTHHNACVLCFAPNQAHEVHVDAAHRWSSSGFSCRRFLVALRVSRMFTPFALRSKAELKLVEAMKYERGAVVTPDRESERAGALPTRARGAVGLDPMEKSSSRQSVPPMCLCVCTAHTQNGTLLLMRGLIASVWNALPRKT